MSAQLKAGIGMVFSSEIFQTVSNPESAANERINSVLLSPGFGPKFFLGNSTLSFSIQAGLGISIASWDWREYKGMGTVYAPAMAGINYGGLSGFGEGSSSWGFSVAYGYQFLLTDLYFRKEEYRNLERDLFFPPIVQLAGGFGGKGAALYVYSRVGVNNNTGGLFSVGIALEVNFIERRKWR